MVLPKPEAICWRESFQSCENDADTLDEGAVVFPTKMAYSVQENHFLDVN